MDFIISSVFVWLLVDEPDFRIHITIRLRLFRQTAVIITHSYIKYFCISLRMCFYASVRNVM